MAKKAKSKASKREYEVVVENHTHKGRSCVVGDKIMLTNDQAERLRKAGIIK